MRSIACPRVATCMVAAAFAGAPTLLLPSIARADDGPTATDAIAAAMDATGVDATLPVEADAVAAADDALASVLDPSGVEATGAAETPSESTADGSTTAPPETASPDVVASGGANPGIEPDSRADTTTNAPDTTSDTASSRTAAGAAPAAAPVSVQTAPTNVAVSVRIGSAGDNGPVTQTNIAAVVSTGASTSTPAPVGGGTTAVPAAGARVEAAAPGDKPAPAAATRDDEGTWSWQWDCVSVPAISLVSPTGSAGTSTPRNWTWIWNCGANSSQYQGATVGQYQPSNVNVAIRVASPGNDGPVSQANIAFAVGSGASVPHGASTPGGVPSTPVAVPIPVPVVSLPGLFPPPPIALLPAVLSPVVPSVVEPLLETGVAELDPADVVPALDGLDGLDGLMLAEPPLVDAENGSSTRRSVPAPGTFAVGPRRPPAVTTSMPASTWRGAASPVPSSTARAPRTTDAKPPRTAPTWHRRAGTTPTPEQAPPGASAAAAGSGGSSGGGLPFLLALPFVAAMLDLARRTALDRVATPSGHRGRMPENPG